jgi:hypothetical protein
MVRVVRANGAANAAGLARDIRRNVIQLFG